MVGSERPVGCTGLGPRRHSAKGTALREEPGTCSGELSAPANGAPIVTGQTATPFPPVADTSPMQLGDGHRDAPSDLRVFDWPGRCLGG